MSVSFASVLKTGVQAARFFFWLYRKLGWSDFKVILVSHVVAVILGLAGVALSRDYIAATWPAGAAYVGLAAPWYAIYACVCLLFGLFYAFRLRKIGIVGADAEVEKGLDYKGSLGLVKSGFDFIGIGASKLTANKGEFTSAVQRAHQHGGKVRLLLCDPRADAVTRLEQLANVSSGSYLVNVQTSFAQLRVLKKQFSNDIEIRIYRPKTDADLVTMRLMLINNEMCLISHNVFGDAKQGKSTPQLHLSSAAWFGTNTTLYGAFRRLFDQHWSGGIEVTDSLFDDIARPRTTRK